MSSTSRHPPCTSQAGAPELAGAVHRCAAACKPGHAAAAAQLPGGGCGERERRGGCRRRSRPLLLQPVLQEAPRWCLGYTHCGRRIGNGRHQSLRAGVAATMRGPPPEQLTRGSCSTLPRLERTRQSLCLSINKAGQQKPSESTQPTLRGPQLEDGPQLAHHLAALRHQLPQRGRQRATPRLPPQRRLGLPAAGRHSRAGGWLGRQQAGSSRHATSSRDGPVWVYRGISSSASLGCQGPSDAPVGLVPGWGWGAGELRNVWASARGPVPQQVPGTPSGPNACCSSPDLPVCCLHDLQGGHQRLRPHCGLLGGSRRCRLHL